MILVDAEVGLTNHDLNCIKMAEFAKKEFNVL